VHDLLDFLARAECVALQAGRDIVEVHAAPARSAGHARRDVLGLLAAWRAMNPAVETDVID
jgi:hypothetical protein